MIGNLKYCIPILMVFGCQTGKKQPDAAPPPLFDKPLTVALDLQQGYQINPLTGDSIKPLINSAGDTIITVKPFIMDPEVETEMQLKRSLVANAGGRFKTIIPSNMIKSPAPVVYPADTVWRTSALRQAGEAKFIFKNSKGIIPTGKPYPVTGVRKKLIEPKPVKVMPMRSKDNASFDIRYLDASMGLGYSYVNAIMEDSKGFLWLGTDGYGLCRYDGVYLTTYTQREGLVSNSIHGIVEDDQGRLWIATNAGISVFDGEGFWQFTEQEGLPGNEIYQIERDRKNNIWFSSLQGGISKYDGQYLTHYSENDGLLLNEVQSFFEDSKGNVWVATSMGLTKFDGSRFHLFNQHLACLRQNYAAAEDRKGNIWFGSNSYGLVKFDGVSFTHYTEKNGLSDNSILSMCIDRNDHLWIATRYGGINKFDGQYFTHYGTEEGLSDDKVSAVMEDRLGNIWACTAGGGINKINVKGFSEPISPEALGNSRVRPITMDTKGNLWFGTEGAGLYQFDGKSITKYFGNNFFGFQGFRGALTDHHGNLWFAESDGSKWYQYDHTRFFQYQSSLINTGFLTLYQDRQGQIWMGTSGNGLALFDGKEMKHYNQKAGLPANRIFSILQDSKSNYWIGTEGFGLLKYDGATCTVFAEKQGLSGRGITSIIEDDKGNLWLGTLGAGLCRFDGKNFTYFSEKQGLAYKDVWSVKPDSSGRIWVGTDRGLSVLIPEPDSEDGSKDFYIIRSFYQQDGLKSTDFNLKSVCIDQTNRIWWGTGKALVTRDLRPSLDLHTPYALSLSYIEINDDFMHFRNLSDSAKAKIRFSGLSPFSNYPENLSLAYDQNHLRFHFSALDWSAPHNLKYSYRLKGLGSQWSEPSESNTADYRGLRHGTYEFQVKAIGTSQQWTETFTYRFTIRPAWWQTWWFIAMCVLLSVALVLLISRQIYLYRLRKQRMEMEKQLAIQLERHRIAAEMHDDIGAGLSGVRLLTELTKSKLKDEMASAEMEKIHQSVGDISSKMKEVIWSLNTENDSMSSLLSYLQNQARSMMENYPGIFSITLPPDIQDVQVGGETRRHIYLLLKEALHNIIKHSGATRVEVFITCNEKFRMVVKDNGKGINPEQNETIGNGMKNMRQRVQQLGGYISIVSENGLTLTFDIPL